eukprot:gene36917-49805_t
MFAPHGICLLWEPGLIWLHVGSDLLIALAYFSIPVALTIFVAKRRDVEFGWIFWAFAIFIMACGLTHVLSIVTLWVPIYGIEGLVKAATAVASVFTAAILWPLLPRLLAIPSPAQLREAQVALVQEGQSPDLRVEGDQNEKCPIEPDRFDDIKGKEKRKNNRDDRDDVEFANHQIARND